MAPLPSFPELMESLGLPADAKPPTQEEGSQCGGDSSSSRSPSPSASPQLEAQPKREPSPTIVVSQFEADEHSAAEESQAGGFKRRASSGNIKSARFSPYANVSTILVAQQPQSYLFNAIFYRHSVEGASQRSITNATRTCLQATAK